MVRSSQAARSSGWQFEDNEHRSPTAVEQLSEYGTAGVVHTADLAVENRLVGMHNFAIAAERLTEDLIAPSTL